MSEFMVDSGKSDALPDNLYHVDQVYSGGVKGFDAVTSEEISRFKQQGFLVIRDAFEPSMVKAAVDGLVNLVAGGRPDFTGLQFEASVADRVETLSIDERLDSLRKLMWFVEYDDGLKALSSNDMLVGVVEQIIGEPSLMFQDMALIKPPRIGREKPWHQDFAYFNLPLGTQVVGVWIALDEAVVENGCMHVIPGSHLDGPVLHWQRRDWQICDTDVQLGSTLAVPLEPGSCLLFDGMLHHGTPPSQSDMRRRAVQYHYKPASVPFFDDDTQRLEVFGPEGKGATC